MKTKVLFVFWLSLIMFSVGLANAQPLPLPPIRIEIGGPSAVPLQKGIARAQIITQVQEFSHQLIYETQGVKNNLVGVIFPAEIYAGARDEILLIAADLESAGRQVFIETYSGGTPYDVRALLQSRWASGGFKGVFGKLPVVLFELAADFYGYSAFPNPLYYMDLDGFWSDNDGNGILDSHTGNTDPEIWVGIIDFSSLVQFGSDEISFTRSYLQKFHQWMNSPISSGKAVAFIDEDWINFAKTIQDELTQLYGQGNVDVVSDSSQTKASDYLDDIRGGAYDFVTLWAHGNVSFEAFKMGADDVNFSGGLIWSYDLMSIQPWPRSLFYNLFSCDNTNFTGKSLPTDQVSSAYIGGAYLSTGSGLIVVGSTKVGGMFNPDVFYRSLSQGKDFGQSFLDWWVDTHKNWSEADFQKWFYGMSILGIPAIGIKPPIVELVSVPAIAGPTAGNTGTAYVFTASSVDNLGHSVQYFFDWDNGTNSGWLSTGTASKSWSASGTYVVKAQARSSVNQNVVSVWSAPLTVVIVAESISTPTISGPTSGSTGTTYIFAASGAISNIGSPVQYFFDWGDGTNSGWFPTGTVSASKIWQFVGIYSVKVQARSATNQAVVSGWSSPLAITIVTINTTPKMVLSANVAGLIVDVPQDITVNATDEKGTQISSFSVTLSGAGINLVGTAAKGKLTFKKVSVTGSGQILISATKTGFQNANLTIPVVAAEFEVAVQAIKSSITVVVKNSTTHKSVAGAAVNIAGQTLLTPSTGKVSVSLGSAQSAQKTSQIPIKITKGGYVDWNASFDLLTKTLKK